MDYCYVGLICKRCNGAYPTGEGSLDPLKPLFSFGPYTLDCFRCKVTDTYDKMVQWLTDQPYGIAELHIADSYISRASKDPDRTPVQTVADTPEPIV